MKNDFFSFLKDLNHSQAFLKSRKLKQILVASWDIYRYIEMFGLIGCCVGRINNIVWMGKHLGLFEQVLIMEGSYNDYLLHWD